MTRFVLSAAATCIASSMSVAANAQADEGNSIDALARRVAAQESALDTKIARLQADLAKLEQDKQALDSIRRQLDALEQGAVEEPQAPATLAKDRTEGLDTAPVVSRASSQRKQSPIDLIAASPLLNPNRFGSAPKRSGGGSFLAPQLSFGSKDRASIAGALPLVFSGNPCGDKGDDCEGKGDDSAPMVRPGVFAVTGAVTTPLTKGEGVLLKRKGEDDDFDYLSGTSIKLGFERYGFEPRTYQTIRKEVARYLVSTLRPKCLAHFGFRTDKCEGDALVNFIDAKDEKENYLNPVDRDKIADMYWRAPEKADRLWGFGGSVSYSSIDYSFVDGYTKEVVGDDGTISLEPVLADALPAATPISRDNWLFEFHAYRSVELGERFKPMLTFQVQRKEQFSFREGAAQNVCTQSDGNGFAIQKCETRNLEKPVYDPQTTLSLGARMRLSRKPFEIAMVPEWHYILENNQQVRDVSLFLGSGDGLKGGIRLRFTHGGTDLLGNKQKDEERISIFFTPFTFHGF